MGTPHTPCYSVGTLGLGVMVYLPVILPILSEESGNIFFRSSILCMVAWFCNGVMVAEWPCKG